MGITQIQHILIKALYTANYLNYAYVVIYCSNLQINSAFNWHTRIQRNILFTFHMQHSNTNSNLLVRYKQHLRMMNIQAFPLNAFLLGIGHFHSHLYVYMYISMSTWQL